MAKAASVASYLQNERGISSRAKLHKLLYYCQAWSLVWDKKPLFNEPIEAWTNGPVCAEVWRSGTQAPGELSFVELETIEAVLGLYGRLNGTQLIELTHREGPWLAARAGFANDARSGEVISLDSMRKYYARLPTTGKSFDPAMRNGIDELLATPADVPPLEEDEIVDAEPFVAWLETGEGDPWASSPG
jgi:uncharacterized phage-associated protein